jgi:hypothetical protein
MREKIHFVQKMNKVVLKKCDNAAMKTVGTIIVLDDGGGKFVSRAVCKGRLRHLRPCPLAAEKTEIYFPQECQPKK